MKRILALTSILALAACSNPAQQAAVTTAIVDVGSCLITTAPALAVATGAGSNATKAVAVGTVALNAVTTMGPCQDAPTAISAAIAAGKVATVTPVAPATP